MQTSDFHYDLPPERIAQHPASPRDGARMLVCEQGEDSTRHRIVRELVDELREGDLLVVNDTRVRPARMEARRSTGGAVELLFIEPLADGAWRTMVRPAKKLRPGEELEVGEGLRARAILRETDAEGEPSAFWRVQLSDPASPGRSVEELLDAQGRMPLPPYIARQRGSDPDDRSDREDYQTVYARITGAVAAPTAGLHFTPELLQSLVERGIRRTAVTLHVGLGTFLPVTAGDVSGHRMHAEQYVLGEETVGEIQACRARGGRVVAVGTTSVRVLESCVDGDGVLRPGAGETRLFVRPGFRFHVVDALLTNFHLPESTLLMLVSALLGRERTLEVYREAVEREYRFYSYGDAMLILP